MSRSVKAVKQIPLHIVYFHYNAFQWATKALQQVLYIDPGFSRKNEVHIRLAIMFKNKSDFEAALKQMSRSVKAVKQIPLHIVYFHYNAFQWATKALQQVLYIDPGFSRKNEVHIRLAIMFKNKSDFEAALKQMSRSVKAVKQIPLHIVYFHYNAFQWATKALQQVLYIDPGFSRKNEVHIRLAIMFKNKSDFEAALKQMSRSVKAVKQIPLHIVYFHYNAFQWATKALQQVLYIDPGFSRKNEVHIRLAIMFKNKSDFEAALKQMSRSVKAVKQIPLHIVYFHYNAFQWATKALQQVLYIDPGFSRKNEVHIRLAIMFKNKSDFEAALKQMSRSVKAVKQIPLHIVYFHYNAFQWATKALQQVLYIDPGFSRKNEVHIRLAIMFKNKSDFEAALKVCHLSAVENSLSW
eukprot:sb/3465223/